MIRIMSTRVIRFYNPNQKLVSDQQTADGMVVQEIAIPAAATIGKEKMTAELFFDTKGNREVQLAPDWIKADIKGHANAMTFQRAVKHNHIIVLPNEEPGVEDAVPVPVRADVPEDRGVAVAPAPGQPLDFPVVETTQPARLRNRRGPQI